MNLLDLFIKIGVQDDATKQIDGITSKVTGGLGKAAKVGAVAIAGATAAASAGAIAITKSAVDAYGSYEQLEGGVKKLYGDASKYVMEYAQNAYKTAGLSANQYMTQATSFSAALIKSLGGDQVKAAQMTDVAMRAMADNVDTFGSDIESVQNAFQGFAKENYTMLDNLKLGFAGTKEGAQQLVKAAAEMKDEQRELGLTVDGTSLSFDNMVAAIAVVQKNMGIAGTTAKEAMTTIEGSVRMAKTSWENFLTAIGAGDEEMIRSSVSGLVDSIFGAFSNETGKREGGIINNILPVVRNVAQAIAEEMPNLADAIVWNFLEAVNDHLGTDLDVEVIMVKLEGLAQRAAEAGRKFIDAFTSNIDTGKVGSILENIASIAGKVFDFFVENADTIGAALGIVADVLLTVLDVITQVADFLTPFLPTVLAFVGALTGMSVITGIITAVGGAFTFLTTVIIPAIGMVQSFGGAITLLVTLLGGPVTAIAAVVAAIVAFIATNENARQVLGQVWEGIKSAFSAAIEAIKGFISGWVENLKQKIAIAKVVLEYVITYARGVYDGVKKWFSQIPSMVTNYFKNAGTWLVNAGKNILNGFLSGLRQAWGRVTSFIGGIGTWIQQHKGPEEYDRKLLVPNGGWIMDGLETGLQKSFDAEVIPYVSKMGELMQGAFGNPMLPVGVSADPSQYVLDRMGGGMQRQSRDLTVILELDRMQFARAVYKLNDEETQRVGMRIGGAY